MFLIVAISITVIGLLILIVVIAFSTKQENHKGNEDNEIYQYGESSNSENEDELVDVSDKNINIYDYSQVGAEDTKRDYLPVLDKKLPYEGLEKELIHFEGDGLFYQIENDKQVSKIQQIEISENHASKKIRGKIYLTPKWIILANEHIKKISLKTIEDFKFIDGYFIIKRKRVKKKKDIFRITEKPAEFYYITKVLLKK